MHNTQARVLGAKQSNRNEWEELYKLPQNTEVVQIERNNEEELQLGPISLEDCFDYRLGAEDASRAAFIAGYIMKDILEIEPLTYLETDLSEKEDLVEPMRSSSCSDPHFYMTEMHERQLGKPLQGHQMIKEKILPALKRKVLLLKSASALLKLQSRSDVSSTQEAVSKELD